MGILKYQSVVQNIIYAGFVEEKSADVRKQILISSMFSLVSIILLFIFGMDNLRTGNSMLATVVLILSVVNAANYIYLRYSGNYYISSMNIVLFMMLLSLYLLCTGGSNNTGPLWFYIMPSLIFYILGLRRGVMMLSLLLTFSAFLLYLPAHPLMFTSYSIDFTNRFIASLFSVSVIAWAYEYSREDGRRELLNLSKKLDELSRRDELTGLANRRDMLERLDREHNRFERNNHPFSVIMADLDHFKQVNDNFGHECGDNVLRLVAKTLSENVQKRDSVARWGGEEILILLPETDVRQAHGIATRLRQEVEKVHLECSNESVGVTLSLGVAEYQQSLTITGLINQADEHLYRAKYDGRNRVRSQLIDQQGKDEVGGHC